MLQLLTFTTLVQRFAAAALAQAGLLLDFSGGSIELALAQASSSVAIWIQWLIVLLLQQIRAATSTGSALDSWMADFMVTRLPATPATGQVTFSRFTPTAAALIPVGATVRTADGSQTFAVVADATQTYWNAAQNGYLIPASVASGNATVQATVAGTGGNVLAGMISLLASAIAGIDSVTNAAAFTNGMAAESDAALRSRFQNFLATRSRATVSAVEYAIQGVQQGLFYWVSENTAANGAYQLGNFLVVVDDGSGDPPTALLTAVQAAIDAVRPVGSTFAVLPPTVITATVTLTIATTPASAKTATLLGQVQSAIASYINALPPGAPLPYSQIYRIAYAVGGAWVQGAWVPLITNITGYTLNGGTADIAGATGQSIKAGTVTVN